MLHRRCAGRSLHAKIADDINNVWSPLWNHREKKASAKLRQYIDVDLQRLYNLDLTTREKPVMNIDNVFLVLYHHWVIDTAAFPDGRQRLQVPFLLLISAYTATQPGALVYSAGNEKKRATVSARTNEDEEDDEQHMPDQDWDNIQPRHSATEMSPCSCCPIRRNSRRFRY